MLQIAMTYEIVTPESAEDGEAADSGFVFEACDCTARELLAYIQREGFNVPSDSPGIPGWLSTDSEMDYSTGETETRSIHPGRDPQSQKVWARVLRIAGIVKGV